MSQNSFVLSKNAQQLTIVSDKNFNFGKIEFNDYYTFEAWKLFPSGYDYDVVDFRARWLKIHFDGEVLNIEVDENTTGDVRSAYIAIYMYYGSGASISITQNAN